MNYILTVLVILLMTGCAAFQPKPNDALARGVYATSDAMDAGRFDLADRFIHEIKRLLPPPKKRIVISPIDK